jgi:hypothetical protein
VLHDECDSEARSSHAPLVAHEVTTPFRGTYGNIHETDSNHQFCHATGDLGLGSHGTSGLTKWNLVVGGLIECD